MFSKNISMLMIASVATVMLLSVASSEEAFAHGRQNIDFTIPGGLERTITVVLGHNDEPTRAQEAGKWFGEHPMELFIRDTRTGLDISTADLVVDKYFYKNEKQALKALENGFEPREEDVPVSGVHGDPGHYFTRQILAKPGFYGYHVTGTVDYFGAATVDVNLKALCRDAPSDVLSAFNSPDFQGGFGCTTDIDDGKFPSKNKRGDD